MSLWNELMKRSCAHRFAWPRIDDDGRHYQVCLLCGSAYEYDWETMCRTNRLLAVSVSQVSPAQALGETDTLPKRQGR
jgi:hypothetical protein